MPNILYIDSETYSEENLKKSGAYRYAEHPSTEITLTPYAWNDEPVRLWDVTAEPIPKDLVRYSEEADSLLAHNATFDRLVFEACMPEYFSGKRWIDTMIRAYRHALPGGLGVLSEIYDLEEGKMKEGKNLIHLFCKPQGENRKIHRATRHTHPEEWEVFKRYAVRDVVAMRRLNKLIPRWNDTKLEGEILAMDRRMNNRGFHVDIDLAEKAVKALAAEKKQRDKEIQDKTDEEVKSATQRDALLKYMLENFDVQVPDMKKSTLERLLQDDNVPEPVKDIIRLRLLSASTSGKKWQTLLDSVCADGRLRGALQYGAAFRTLRWGGRLFQPQNLPKPEKSLKKEIPDGILLAKAEILDAFYASVVPMLSAVLRGAITVPEGKKMVVSDLSAIEGRGLAFLANERWKLEAYSDYDAGIGHDMYVRTYAQTFGISANDVDEYQRQIGKVLELACGYGGGVGAFVTMALVFGIDLDELAAKAKLDKWAVDKATAYWEFAHKKRMDKGLKPETFIAIDAIKRMWRAANSNIMSYWYKLEDAVRQAVRYGDTVRVNSVVVDKKGSWLRIKLPSGRYLLYPGIKVDSDGKISYLGLNTYTRKWCRLNTYGGKLCIAKDTIVVTKGGLKRIQNVTQNDEVWDGVSWVPCGGAILNGVKKVVNAFAVDMTPDHAVLTEEGWKYASQSGGHNRFKVRTPDSYSLRRIRREKVALDSAMRLWKRDIHARFGAKKTKSSRDNIVLRMQEERVDIETEHKTRHVEPSAICGVEIYGRPVQTSFPPSLQKLRRAWYSGLREMGTIVREFLRGCASGVCGGSLFRPDRQRWELLPRERSMGGSHNAVEEQKIKQKGRHPLRGDDGGRTLRKGGDRADNAIVQVERWVYSEAVDRAPGRFEKVYDILNCGPLHRFTVVGADGKLLIVHNCENLTQAFCRDIFAVGTLQAEKEGYEPVLLVHDEVVAETPDSDEFTAEGLSECLCVGADWAKGLPLAAEGFESKRYRK